MATKFKSSVEIDGYLSLTSGNWVQVPDGTTAQRPGSPTVGMFRYNTTTNQFEGYFGATPAWGAIGGGGGTVTEAFKTIAVSGQSDIVADQAADTLNIAAGNNISLTTDAATDTLTIESSGGGGSVTVQRNNYTANGSTTVYGVSSTIASENNIQIYLDGVYQDKDTYTTSGSNVTFSTAPPNTTEIEIIHYVAVGGVIEVDEFVGDGTTTNFSTSLSIINEDATQVYVSGVYQSKLTYQTTGNVVTFTTAPPNGANIEVVHIKAMALSGFDRNAFTGDGTTTAFTLSAVVNEENMSFVFIQGVYQDKDTYSISGTTLTFVTAPQSGYTVEVMVLSAISASTNALYTDTFTGNGSTTAYALGITPVDLNAIEVYLNGLYQNVSTLSLSGNTVTFATAPPNGVIIEIRSVGFLNSGGTLAPATLTGGTGISVTTNSPNNFTIANTLGAGIDWDTNIQASNFSANPGRGYIVNTTSGEITINLPAGVPGNIVAVQDYAGTFDTNNLLIVANGTDKIQARTTDAKSNIENTTIYLLYQDATRGWTADNIADNPPFGVSYLVVAGGGQGGTAYAGGGGAGGYKTNYGGTTLTVATATNYTVTVGAGGGGGSTGSTGVNGSNSVFSTIISTGGGGGGSDGGYQVGADGGSGGGGAYQNYAGGTATPAGQGNDGGSGSPDVSSGNAAGGGGGGAGAAGQDSPSKNSGGNGGDGLSNSITGSAVFYAGGGGGGNGSNSTGSPGNPGQGGGGGGGKVQSGAAATANTGGGGGGGGGSSSYVGGAGGSGIVILRYVNTHTLTNPGGGLTLSTSTDGSDKVTSITAGTGNIQFN